MAFQVNAFLTLLNKSLDLVLIVVFTFQTQVIQNLRNIKEPRRRKRKERKMKNRERSPLHTLLLKAVQPQVLSLKEKEGKEQEMANIRQLLLP